MVGVQFAHATGALILDIDAKSLVASRISKSEVDINVTLVATEGSLYAGDKLCTDTATYHLNSTTSDSLPKTSTWTIVSISYSQPQNDSGTGGQCAVNSSGALDIVNRNGLTNGKVATLPTAMPDNKYSFQIALDTNNTYQLSMLVNGQATVGPESSDTSYYPVSVLAEQLHSTLTTPGSGPRTVSDTNTIPVSNYDLKNGKVSSGGGVTINCDFATLKNWLPDPVNIQINIDHSSTTTPPYFFFAKNNFSTANSCGSTADRLDFILAAANPQGAAFASSTKWLIFSGYDLSEDGKDTKINGLYFITNENQSALSGSNYFLYSSTDTDLTNADNVHDLINNGPITGGMDISSGTTVHINQVDSSGGDNSIDAILSYLIDVPKGATDTTNNCASKEVYTTGPNVPPADGKTSAALYADSDKFPPESTQSKTAWDKNANCIDTSATGWAAYWKLVVAAGTSAAATDCTISGIFTGFGTTIAQVMSKVFTCIYTGVISDGIKWATGWVTNAAGLSYKPAEVAASINSRGGYAT